MIKQSIFEATKLLFTNKNSTNMSLERNREVITRLKFIGKFQPGEKVDVSNLKIETNSIVTPLKRFLQGESRETLYIFINNTIERSFDIIESLMNSDRISDRSTCKNIVIDLKKCIIGLDNIKKTYSEDKIFECNIEVISEMIEGKMTELFDKRPDFFHCDNQSNI